ncbi:MAG TPA: hypothetical protein DCM57_07165 [Treponema sp.]|jgi:diguanylate cyclase (GGDEF)-like protein|nr:hypothetical protein [Treponema sp.]
MAIELNFKNILDTLSQAVYVASPIRRDGEIIDFRIDYTNERFLEMTGNFIHSGMTFNEFKDYLTKEVPWVQLAKDVLSSNNPLSKIFYSGKAKCWIHLFISCPAPDCVVVTLLDVTSEKENEQNLKQRDLRNATLTEELSLTRTNMRTKLESIQALNSQLQFAAYHDTMTNLCNRACFNKDVEKIKGNDIVGHNSFGLMLLDIDNMKNVNESEGHNKGDSVIRHMATILRSMENNRTSAYRFGGDEFIVVRNKITSRDEMTLLAYELLKACNAENIGFSGGIAIFPEDSSEINDLLRFADMAKTEVKKNGKNNVFFYQKIMQDKFLRKMLIENKLHKAIEENLFQLYFQPQFDVSSGALRGFEALLRWRDDELGWISPDQFIPLAEESRMVIPLGDWVMETAIKTLRQWENEFNFDGIMSVNVSPIQFKNENFIDSLIDKTKRYGINVSHLEIEITEGMLIDNIPDTVSKLNTIREMGIGISLDDFGTGYSSLRYLQILPLTTLKIDKSFISNINQKDGVEANITESIVSMVTKMGLDTIAEGVETDSQLDMLKKFKCHNVQGFLKGKPMPQELCDRMLSGDQSAILTVKNVTPESQ